MVDPRGPQMKIWSVLLVSWINKATGTNPEYVILMTFPQQKWLGESGSMLLLCMYFSTWFSQFSLGLYLTYMAVFDGIWHIWLYLTVFDCICFGAIWLIWPIWPYLTYLTVFNCICIGCIWLYLTKPRIF